MGSDRPRLRPSWWDLPVVLAVLALSWLSLPRGAKTATVVEIRQGGTVVERISPGELLDAPRQYSRNGWTLTLAAEQTAQGIALRVTEADCPGLDCVHTGAIRLPGESIVCLPAQTVITLTGGDGAAVDAVTG